MPRLIVTNSTGAVTEHEIGRGSASIGRSSECEVVVLESEASRRHAVVEYDGRRLLLRDEGSHNGTYVNGERVASGPEGRTELSHGDEIRIGGAVLKVVMEEPAEGGGAKPELARREAGRRLSEGPEQASGSEEATKDEAAWKVGDEEVIEGIEGEEARKKDAPEKEAKERGAKKAPKEPAKKSANKPAKKAAKRRPSRRKADRDTADEAASSGRHRGPDQAVASSSEPARTSRRKRVILGGMRLSKQQQTMVKVASFGVIVISLIGVAWMLNYMSNKPKKRSQRIIVDPRAEPERLAEEAGALARQARVAEDTGDIREALRFISEAKEKIEEADRLYSIVAEQYQDKGPWRGQVKSRQIKTQAYGIRTQHFRLDMQVRREEGRL